MVERIGTPGVVWATHYANGWTVYTLMGPIKSGLNKADALNMINSLLPKKG